MPIAPDLPAFDTVSEKQAVLRKPAGVINRSTCIGDSKINDLTDQGKSYTSNKYCIDNLILIDILYINQYASYRDLFC